jgi:hypothetical protein
MQHTAIFQENSSITLSKRKIQHLTVKVGNCLGTTGEKKMVCLENFHLTHINKLVKSALLQPFLFAVPLFCCTLMQTSLSSFLHQYAIILTSASPVILSSSVIVLTQIYVSTMVTGLADYFRQHKGNTRIMPHSFITEVPNTDKP